MCLLSGEPTTPVGGRPWSVLPQAGCGGRYVPEAETEAEAEAELASERSSTELVASSDGGLEASNPTPHPNPTPYQVTLNPIPTPTPTPNPYP